MIVADYDADGATACAVGDARARGDGRRRRFPRAESLRIRLRAHAGNRRPGGRARAAPHRDRRQRHREPRRRRGGGGARHRSADHRSSPAGGHASGARADRQSESGRVRVSGQASRRRRRHVLRAARHPRRVARARSFRRPRRSPISARCSISSRSAPSPTSCASTGSTGRWSRTGLARIRAGRAQPGINALFAVAGRDPRRATSYDLGFVVGPRLNAAGRLSDMTLGIRCLLADTRCGGGAARRRARPAQSRAARRRIRRCRKTRSPPSRRERAMPPEPTPTRSACSTPSWHQGVVGIVAGRLKDRYHRPAIVFARGKDGELKGSGRSIAGFHLRDALDLASKRAPGCPDQIRRPRVRRRASRSPKPTCRASPRSSRRSRASS